MTERQRLFVEHYLVLRDATAAALRAGYKPSAARIIGWQLLRKAWVQAAIEARSRGADWPPPQPRRGVGLTPRQRRFAEEYLIDTNATKAAIRAGYSRRSAPAIGCQLLKVPHVAEAIAQAAAARSARLAITGDQIVGEWGRIAFFDFRRVMDWGPGGVAVKPSAELGPEEGAAIASVSARKSKNGATRLRVRALDKHRALQSLARHFQLFTANAAPKKKR